MEDFSISRANMIQNQLRPCGICDPNLLEAFAAVPRENFLPEALRAGAYTDVVLPLETGFMLDPLTHARLLALAAPQKSDIALVVAADGGYAAAVLAPLVATILEAKSVKGISSHGHAFVETDMADVEKYAQHTPFDIVFLAGAVVDISPAFREYLSPTGRLVTVLRSPNTTIGHGVLMRRTHETNYAFDSFCPYLPHL